MDFLKPYNDLNKPELYAPGDAIMWTDDYISRQLLEIHLNPEIDAASRKPESIYQTIEFICQYANGHKMHILDLGCGPGIYAEHLERKGHQVTGVDFSENSVRYAKEQAQKKKLNIEYLCQNYLELNFANEFDLILMIYTDFGVLIPDERNALLSMIYTALKPGGIFIFDVLNDRNAQEKFKEQRSWQIEDRGFWKDCPYLELIHGKHYPESKVYLKQHTVIDLEGSCNTYRFWIHYYKYSDLAPILISKGFENIQTFDDILPENDIWNGDNVTFYAINKPN